MQPCARRLGQIQVASRLQVFRQTVIQRGKVHILGVAHHRQAFFGGDPHGLIHYPALAHAFAVLADEADVPRQRPQMAGGLAVEVFRDGHTLVHVAQADAPGVVHDALGNGRGRTHRPCVRHAVDERVTAPGSRPAAGVDILLILKARRAEVAVQVNESRQQRAAACIQHRIPAGGKALAHGRDDAVFNAHIARTRTVRIREHGIANQHKPFSFLFLKYSKTAKKNFSQNGKSLKSRE